MAEKNRRRNAAKKCTLCGNRRRFKKIHRRGGPRGRFNKKHDRLRHFWLCLRCGI